ncbi:MAG TPA: hypothetical protein VG298_15005, partial [Acidimicrobiales bacterium]|nr:hypothetical protein [Acidimicrobiales bacterium]
MTALLEAGAPAPTPVAHLAPSFDAADARASIFRTWPFALGLFYLLSGSFFVNAHVLIGDALSRTATARMVVAGADPHFGALGWVWGPLPTLLEVPLVSLGGLAPWLVKDGYAGVIVSAVFGAWAAWHLFRLLVERGTGGSWSAIITAGFALNPFVIIFSGNGMSEAIYLCFLLGAVRHLSRFQQSARPSALALAGLYLGLDCLVRFESLAAAVGAMVFISVVSWQRGTAGAVRERLRSILVKCLIIGFPVAFCFILFVGFSWWLTDQALAQYSSLYGQSAQIVGTGLATFANVRVPQVAVELLALSPALAVVLPLALWRSLRGRGSVFPCAACVLGPALLFDVESLSTGGLFNLMRYLILIIPLTVIALVTVAGRGRMVKTFAVATIALSFAGAWWITGNRSDASQEYAYHQAVLGHSAESMADLQLGGARAVTAWLDAQSSGSSSILLDTYDGFEILAETDHPGRYVIPADQDYQQILEAPYQHGVRYLVTIPPAGPGALYILNRYYPGLFEGCLTNTQLVLT